MIQKLIGGAVVILVGTSLLPEVARQVRGYPTIFEKIPNPKPHKQTYLEYVKERLEVEKLMK
jgi:hypothetical protein